MSPDRARILVLEDRPADRLYLTTILKYRQYTILEAANGAEGLAVAIAERPDLVISDVLMPQMDGYEFVRRLRRAPEGVGVPVIFYTATFHERDARALAKECGVVDVMIKPCEPQAILDRVETVLRRGRTTVDPIADERFDRHHARLATETLLAKTRDLEVSEGRMSAIVELGQRFIEERDPVTLLNRVCETVRSVTNSRYAIVGLFNKEQDRVALLLTSGHDEKTTDYLRSRSQLPTHIKNLAFDRQPIRGRNPDGRAERLDLPPWHEPIHSYMAVPMASSSVYGYFWVAEKVGAAEFSEADEVVATSLGVQAGIAYENAMLINELEAQATALRDSEAMTEFALSAAGVGVYQEELPTRRVRQSKAVSRMFGVREDATLLEMLARLHPDDHAAANDAIEKAMRTNGEFAFDARSIDSSGRMTHQAVRGRIIADAQGAPARLVAVVIDMSERRQLEAQLRQAQKMEAIGQLAGGVAHDFNNLLTAILGYAHFLMSSSLDKDQANDLAEIAKAGERAVALNRQLLAFSRRQAQELTVFNLNSVILDLARMLDRLLGEDVRLTTDLLPNLAPLYADRAQIEQVIMNLAVNARDAMPNGGELRIRTAELTIDDVRHVQLIVSDTGFGMNEETKARIFEPFFTTKEAGKGTGLGLATVFAIATQSGGTVTVDSAPGRGTTFTVTLPRARGEVAEATETAAPVVRGTESILVVEDENSVRVFVRAILKRAGYDVVDAPSPADALREAETRSFDLLLTDVVMAGSTGPELFRQLVPSRPHLRVLYMSGYAKDTLLDTRRLGANSGFIPKPFTAGSLTRKVREILDR
jgi:PAS domain S-box-containing protein